VAAGRWSQPSRPAGHIQHCNTDDRAERGERSDNAMAHSAHARDNHWRRAELRDTNWRHSRYRPVGAAAVEWIWATLAVMSVPGLLHHIEIWVTNLHIAERSWGWLPAELGYSPCQAWSHGRSWSLDSTYIVIEQSPDVRPQPHDRLAADLNHLAFHAGTEADVDRLTAEVRGENDLQGSDGRAAKGRKRR
jgi:hypothetical protein